VRLIEQKPTSYLVLRPAQRANTHDLLIVERAQFRDALVIYQQQ
jgi:hypothetical protein